MDALIIELQKPDYMKTQEEIERKYLSAELRQAKIRVYRAEANIMKLEGYPEERINISNIKANELEKIVEKIELDISELETKCFHEEALFKLETKDKLFGLDVNSIKEFPYTGKVLVSSDGLVRMHVQL